MNHHYKTLLSTGAALALSSGLAYADQVFNDDVIITQSLCVGNDCVNGESFGFDTIRMKENNTRVKFDDTSASASFPSNDWQLTANDSSNGGANKFSVDDITGARTPFTIEAGTRSHQLYLDSASRVGFGTNTPVVDLHVKQGNTPTLRLEQDGSSGFTAQTWDIAGNEANFFIRDVTNGSKLSFRIEPNTPENTLYLDNANRLGMGTSSPSAALHLRRTDGSARVLIQESSGTQAVREMLRLENNGGSYVTISNSQSSRDWFFTHENNPAGRFIINASTNPSAGLFLSPDGDMSIGGTLTTGGGTCGGGCDLVFSEDYDLPSIEEHSEKMFAQGYLPNVGPTIENAPINVSDKLGRMLNELEHAHIYIDTLHRENQSQKKAIAALTARLDALETNGQN
jgi:hypothetical protein